MLEAGQPHEAERLHRLKSQADAAKDRVRKTILDESQMLFHASELSLLMLKLSRDFDAAGWSLLERARATNESEVRICFDRSIPVSAALLASASDLSAPFARLEPSMMRDFDESGGPPWRPPPRFRNARRAPIDRVHGSASSRERLGEIPPHVPRRCRAGRPAVLL